MEVKEFESVSRQVPEVRVKLGKGKKLIKKKRPHFQQDKAKLNELKAKVYFSQMQKLRKAPEINKVSQEIARCSRLASPPRTPYVKKILSNKQFPKCLASQSITTSARSSPIFAMLSENSISRSPILVESKKKPTKSVDFFSRNLNFIKKKEENLDIKRKEKLAAGLRECTFSPKLSTNSSRQARSRSKSVNTSFVTDKLLVCRYKSLSPSPSRYGYPAGCNLVPIKEKSTPMFKYLALKMPYF